MTDTESNFPINFQPMPKRFMVWDKEKRKFSELYEGFWQVAMISDHSVADNKRCVVVQSTGLFDKDGKEIFEGSIIQTTIKEQKGGDYYKRNYMVQYDHGLSRWMFCKDENNVYKKFGLSIYRARNAKVVGHILSNPELLEGGNV